MNSITSIIDADTMIYLIAYQAKDEEDVDVVSRNVDVFVNTILSKTNCTYYLGFLGGSKCFRHNLTDDYKANRGEKPDWFVKWSGIITHLLIDKWKFIVVDGIEAEDACIIAAEYYRDKSNVVLCHVDKDLSFWEGNHFLYNKHEFFYSDKIGELELNKSKLKGKGLKWQYAQIICGDTTDNIKGLKGKGPAFAHKLLDSCTTEAQLFIRTYKAYLSHCKEENIREYFKLQWNLIVMLKEESYGFEVPTPREYNKFDY